MALFICQGCGTEQSSWDGKCVHCGTTEIIKLAPKTDKMVDRVVDGRYRIIRKLGQGGMGAVYLAESLGIGQRVALKFLRADLSEDPEIAKRFMTEAKSYALVDHPNAVMLHDFRQDSEGNLYISMEYCEGADLKKVLADQRKLGVAEAVEIVLQAADVLGYAHAKGVIHRDLKPENVMIRKGMRGLHVKVLDFGIARLKGAATQVTMQGSIAGTPRYMAPEQVEGKAIDHRIDVYALGIVLFELLTGVQPFDGDTVAEILRAQVVNPTPHLARYDVDAPEVDAVIQRATAKDRDQRYPDMARFAAALSVALPTAANLPVLKLTQVAGESGLDGTFVRVKPDAPPAQAAPGLVPWPPHEEANVTRTSDGSAQATQLQTPPKSRAPVALGAVALLAVAGVGGYFAWRETKPGPVPPVSPVAPIADPVVAREPPEAPDSPELMHLRAVEFLSRADAAFRAGDFGGAKVYLGSIPADPEVSPKAAALRELLDTVETKLAHGRDAASRGDCLAAIRAFNEVLKLNPNVKDALVARNKCRDALPPSTVE